MDFKRDDNIQSDCSSRIDIKHVHTVDGLKPPGDLGILLGGTSRSGKSYMELRSRRIDEMSYEDLIYVIEYILNA
jgi:hypothetical protein